MIVAMKKATILFESRDAEATVQSLRASGVLHVEHQNPPEGRDISVLQEKVALIDSSFDVMQEAMEPGKTVQPQKEISGDWTGIADRLVELGRSREQLETSSRNIIGQINEWERWGDVDLSQILQLRQNGIYLKLYQMPVKETGTFPDNVIVKTIFISGDIAHCAVISRTNFECAFPEVAPPKLSVSLLRSRLAENAKAMEMITTEIVGTASYYETLFTIRKKLEKEIEFQQVLGGMGREGAISYVTGYIPFDIEGDLITKARDNRWGVMITEPSAEDNVPTLLRNPRWVTMIEPVLNLLGLTPGYHELDVSMLFLIFFSIFFGILIGDAGYGLVYILLTLLLMIWLQKKMKLDKEMKTVVSLFFLLGSCTVIWGLLTGTFFGQGWLTPLVPQLNNPNVMGTFCFFLGALHLSIAHAWRAYLKFPSLTALTDVGYICILWTAFFLARTLILGDAFPTWGIWLVAAGVVLVILFTNPRRHSIFRGIGEGLGTMALSFMNNITDVISYIRLFAVSLASLAVAETTNYLASGFGSGAIALAAGVVILLFGHSLNMILGLMSVLVHGVRLNVLEFSGHANVTWSGTTFEPLKE